VNVQFSLLGPVRAWRSPAELDIGSSRQRAILALLLVRANQLVSVGDMVELLWGQDPPGSAVNTIHKYIGAIRRLLEPGLEARAGGRWLTRHGGAYRLAADESMSDLIAFRRMVKDAGLAAAEGRPADALDLLLEAVALRRGACGEDLDLRGRNRDYFTAVDQEYIAATGQQASALSHYQVVRERLNDELGVDPGAEMRAAQSKVLRQEFPAAAVREPAGLAATPGPTRPSPGSASGPAPLVSPAQLPADLPAFAGREPELSQLSGLLHLGEIAGTVAIGALIRAYAMELSERSDTDADRHEAQARLLHHYLHSSYAVCSGTGAGGSRRATHDSFP